MKVRLVGPERSVCRLERGEAKRLPRGGGLLGFYFACPACARLNLVIAEGQLVEESKGELRRLVPGTECENPRCAKHIHVKNGEFVLTDVCA